MRLDELSREGSFLYADDFRVGMNLFARGALMAAEMDDRIRSQTQGQKSLRDALRHLMDWSAQNHRAFRVEELPVIFRQATDVDTADILDRWMQAPRQPLQFLTPP
jgi:predicted metalloprotease with PDZ domain